MLFFLNSPLLLFLIQSTLRSARTCLGPLLPKTSFTWKTAAGSGTKSPVRDWRAFPAWSALPPPGKVENPLRLTLSCLRTQQGSGLLSTCFDLVK